MTASLCLLSVVEMTREAPQRVSLEEESPSRCAFFTHGDARSPAPVREGSQPGPVCTRAVKLQLRAAVNESN